MAKAKKQTPLCAKEVIKPSFRDNPSDSLSHQILYLMNPKHRQDFLQYYRIRQGVIGVMIANCFILKESSKRGIVFA